MAKKNKEKVAKKDQELEEGVEAVEEQGVTDKEGEVAELRDKYLRLYAEFDNYKKRTARERLDLIKTASEDLVSRLLPVLDDFDRVKQNAENSDNAEAFSEGVMLVYNKLKQVLESKGLKVMDTEDLEFDPELHEAITKIAAPSEDLKGKIIDFIEKGYYLNDKIIRYAKVVIGE